MTEPEVYAKNYISCLNWISYWTQEQRVIDSKNNKNKIL